MKVKDLIEKLKSLNDELDVFLDTPPLGGM